MNKNTLYIECYSGVAGDMFVGALLDLGVGSIDLLKRELAKIDLAGWSIATEKTKVSGLAASRFVVEVASEQQQERSFAQIEELVASSRLSAKVRSRSLAIFSRVARAEADAHGESLQTVHFHEVGMVDSIIDVVAACILMEELSAAEVIGSPVALGAGIVETQHGPMRVPVPATAILLRGVPVYQGEEKCELATPTGAALISYYAGSFGPIPLMTMESVGYGAGTRQTRGSDVVRMILGERVLEPGQVVPEGTEVEQQMLLETNIDDSTPERLAFLVERLLGAGALDAWMTPVTMKKGRAAVILSALCHPEAADDMLDIVFTESATFGVRSQKVERYCLERRILVAETKYGPVRVKIGKWRGREVAFSPEYEDCRRLAEEHHVPIASVYEAASLAARSV